MNWPPKEAAPRSEMEEVLMIVLPCEKFADAVPAGLLAPCACECVCVCVSVQFAPVKSFAMKAAVPGSGSYLISGSPFFFSSLESFL